MSWVSLEMREKLFDETISGLEFSIGTLLNLESTLNLLTDHDRSKREMGANELSKVFLKILKFFHVFTIHKQKKKKLLTSGEACRLLNLDAICQIMLSLR